MRYNVLRSFLDGARRRWRLFLTSNIPGITVNESGNDPSCSYEQIVQEYATLMSLGSELIPSKLSDKDITRLSKLPDIETRSKHYSWLKLRERNEANDVKARETKRSEREARLQFYISQSNHICYSILRNAIVCRERYEGRRSWFKMKYVQSAFFSPKLLIDLCYFDQLTYIKQNMLAQDIKGILRNNKFCRTPLNIYLVNAKLNDEEFVRQMVSHDLAFMTPHYLAEVSDKSPEELFDRESLIYLSPDAPMKLTTFDYDKIYILGGSTENDNEGASLKVAQSLGITCRSFPLDDLERKRSVLTMLECAQFMQKWFEWGDLAEVKRKVLSSNRSLSVAIATSKRRKAARKIIRALNS